MQRRSRIPQSLVEPYTTAFRVTWTHIWKIRKHQSYTEKQSTMAHLGHVFPF